MSNRSLHTALLSVSLAFAAPCLALADAPDLKSATPVIYLADNLDEKDRLGWCIDTVGRGFNDTLHAHSCKPARTDPMDTQFSYDASTGLLRSVAFDTKCVSLLDGFDTPFGLIDCQADDAMQVFDYDAQSQEIRVKSIPDRCMVVGDSSRSAGPFMSRDLNFAICADVEPPRKQWIIKG